MRRSFLTFFVASLAITVLCSQFSGCRNDENESEPGTVIDTHLEIELIQSSSVPTLEEIKPYEETLTINEYRVIKVIDGPEPKSDVIRIAQWAISNNKALPLLTQKGETNTVWITPFKTMPELNSIRRQNDLDLDLDSKIPLYFDLTPLPESYAPPKNIRYDYRSDLSRRMQVYWILRHQIKLVVIGNSHAATAIDPQLFYQPGNNDTPVSLSMSPAGSGISYQCIIADQYAATLPSLEWVVWGVSPRIFNQHLAIETRAKMFENSPGYLYDRQNWQALISQPAPDPLITFRQFREKIGTTQHPWGWSKKKTHKYSIPQTPEDKKDILKRCDRPKFRWNPDAWSQFQKSVENLTQKNIQVLLFTPPYHPLVAQARTADGDGTGHSDYDQIVEQLQDLSQKIPSVHFLDIHKGGQHKFKHEHFSDIDHLHQSGARILTRQLVDFVENISDP